MNELKLSTKQVRELFEVMVIVPDLDKEDIKRCQSYAKLFASWLAQQMMVNSQEE